MWVQNRTGSLSAASRPTQARFRAVIWSSHWATTVVLPYPAGAATRVSGQSAVESSRARMRRSEHPLGPQRRGMQLRFQERVDPRQRRLSLTAVGPPHDRLHRSHTIRPVVVFAPP